MWQPSQVGYWRAFGLFWFNLCGWDKNHEGNWIVRFADGRICIVEGACA